MYLVFIASDKSHKKKVFKEGSVLKDVRISREHLPAYWNAKNSPISTFSYTVQVDVSGLVFANKECRIIIFPQDMPKEGIQVVLNEVEGVLFGR